MSKLHKLICGEADAELVVACTCLSQFFLFLQACWKGYKQRKVYKERMNLLQKNVASIVKVMNYFCYE